MRAGLRLGRIAGVEIRLDWSLVIVFLLVVFSLGVGVFPFWHPEWSVVQAWVVALAAALMFFVSVLAHELSHALVGRAQGIDIRRLTLFVFGGMAHLETEPHSWRAELWMALVGPVASLAIGMACLFGASWAAGPIEFDPERPLAAMESFGAIGTILLWLGQINILLALFNLVPGFPLDGGRVLRAVLWGVTGNMVRATRWAAGAGQLFAWLLIGCGFAMMLGLRVPVFGAGTIGGIWIAVIGWFLNNAALMSYQQVRTRRALEQVPVSRLMLSEFASVEPQTTVEELVDDYLLTRNQRSFPVLEQDRLVGLASLDDVLSLPIEQRAQRRVADIMTPARELEPMAPTTPAAEAFRRLASGKADPLPVVSEGRLRGLLRREDLFKWLALHTDDAALAR